MTILSTAILMFLVMDPLGNIAFFLAALVNVPESRQRAVVTRELLFALIALVTFMFCGRFALDVLHLSEPALTISGGIILMLIALRMIFPSPDIQRHEQVSAEPFIVPLAIPYVAGPSAMATELLLMSREPNRWPEWLLAVVLAWLVSSIILFFAGGLRKYLGERGLIAIERLMGMVLVTVAVQMLLNGTSIFMTSVRR